MSWAFETSTSSITWYDIGQDRGSKLQRAFHVTHPSKYSPTWTIIFELFSGLLRENPVRAPWKWLETRIHSRQGSSHNKWFYKSAITDINSRKHVSRSAIILVPTVFPDAFIQVQTLFPWRWSFWSTLSHTSGGLGSPIGSFCVHSTLWHEIITKMSPCELCWENPNGGSQTRA